MEMTKAFGNKQQTNATNGNQSTQPIENPKEALGQCFCHFHVFNCFSMLFIDGA
jgi:hypothetical protein